ncbi:MAG: heavy-metal-associated domain-containing protein [Rhodobacterales bacterium]
MRKIFTTAFVVLLTLSHAAFAGQTYSLQVDGLACPFCAYGIEKQLTSVDYVQDVVVDLNAGAVRVTMQDGSNLDEATAKQAVKDAGFTLKGFKRAPE